MSRMRCSPVGLFLAGATLGDATSTIRSGGSGDVVTLGDAKAAVGSGGGGDVVILRDTTTTSRSMYGEWGGGW